MTMMTATAAVIISTLLTFAHLSTRQSSVKAFTVFLLTHGFLTVTTFKLFKIVRSNLILMFD